MYCKYWYLTTASNSEVYPFHLEILFFFFFFLVLYTFTYMKCTYMYTCIYTMYVHCLRTTKNTFKNNPFCMRTYYTYACMCTCTTERTCKNRSCDVCIYNTTRYITYYSQHIYSHIGMCAYTPEDLERRGNEISEKW